MRHVIVVGGGLSGLACAWTLVREARRAGGEVAVTVLERAPEVGGKARTIARDGWLVESGPSSFMGGRPELERLIDEAGVRGEVIRADPASSRRWVHERGRAREVRPNPLALVRAGLLSPRGAMRLLREPFVRRRRDGVDESVWDFAARRVGPEFAHRLVEPMALGIFAGDAHKLSLGAAFPAMAALEREHGSLVRGMVARRRQGLGPRELRSFRRGMQQLPLALAERGHFTVRCGAAVESIARDGDGWRVRVAGEWEALHADALVLAGEPWAMAQLVAPHAATIASELRSIHCPPVAVVATGWAPDVAARVPAGFGTLVARHEEFRMLGALRETHLYPERGPAGHLLVRAIFGGTMDPGITAMDEDSLGAFGSREVARMLGTKAHPVFTHVVKVPRAIPQYELGHGARVARIDEATRALPGLWLTGFGLRGVAFADVAADGMRTGAEVARAVQEMPAYA